MRSYGFGLLLCLGACVTPPNTQSIIDSTLEWKRIEDEELTRHAQLASVAKFSEDPVENAASKAKYMTALERHGRMSDQFANALVNWAQRVGKFDPEYADKTLDRMIDLYLKIREKEGN